MYLYNTLFWQIVASKGSSVCMADCTSLLTPHPPSLYEQYCCIPSNSGKTFTVKEKDRVKIIICPFTLKIPTSCSKYTFSYDSCNALLQVLPATTSGYYSLTLCNGSNCDGKGGWMRVDYVNMSEPGATCPPGLILRQYNNIDHGLCGQPMSFTLLVYSVNGFNYSKVCGQIRGYHFGVPDGFPPYAIPNIENCNSYVDGVTITYGSNPRKHIWTYARETVLGNDDLGPYSCPCNNDSSGTSVPEWVGNDYYYESALYSSNVHLEVLFSNDTLWDGQLCNGNEGPCCTNPKMPWFIKKDQSEVLLISVFIIRLIRSVVITTLLINYNRLIAENFSLIKLTIIIRMDIVVHFI